MSDWSDQIEADLNWREAELASLKLLVADAPKGSVRENSLLRALWTMLYAHYEGFCKFAWDLYLDGVEKANVQRCNCRPEIARLSLRGDFKMLGGDLSPSAIWTFCTESFQNLMNENIQFEVKLETKSNLWPNVVRENSTQAGLPCCMVTAHEPKLKALVGRRNDIAHGQKMVIKSLNEYQEYENSALLVMHELAVAIIDALEKQSYLLAVPPAG